MSVSFRNYAYHKGDMGACTCLWRMEGKEEETEIWDGWSQGEFYYQPAGMLRDIPAFAADLFSAQT